MSTNFPFNIGPNAFERNPPIHPEFYKPSNFVVSNITSSGIQTQVTTVENNNFVVGQLIRFHIPNGWGIRQLNERQAYVTEIISSNQFVADINILSFDPFAAAPLPLSNQFPQVSAIGDNNYGGENPNGRIIIPSQLTVPGAFVNIS